MSRFLLDTNCLLSYFTDRSPRQHVVISSYLERARRLEITLHLAPTVVTELVFVLDSVYGEPSESIADLLVATLDSPGLEYLEAHPIRKILELWPDSFPHYADAALAAVAHTSRLTLLTFDRAFARALKRRGIRHRLLA